MKTFKRDSRPYTKTRGGFGGGGFSGGAGGGFRGGRDRDGGREGGERERPTMHRATCVRCEKSCEVPFRPNGTKPVFCNECFGKDTFGNSNGDSRGSSRSFGGGESRGRSGGSDAGTADALRALDRKLDTILRLLENK